MPPTAANDRAIAHETFAEGALAPTGKSHSANAAIRISVFFGPGMSAIAAEYRATVEAHARYLVDHPEATVAIQGHCDERGTREYNLALGQLRADAVARILLALGVPRRQMTTMSFGQERPQLPGHAEAAWARNRRVDIVGSN